jgi:hypothetical protein
MNVLTADEIAFLVKIEKQRKKHAQSQALYRSKHQEEIKDYNKKHYEDERTKLNEINKKIVLSTPINIEQIIVEPPKIDKRTRRGKKITPTTNDIQPSYETRKAPLEYSTIEDYIKKADILQRFYTTKSLSQQVKAELRKLLNDNQKINEPLILNEMTYINNDIEPTIAKLREHYKNDNSFKSYINILAVITSHFKTLDKQIYQTLTKTNIYVNKKVQEVRENNELDEVDFRKIIDLDRTTILSNITKLKRIDDILLYALYTLFPARRCDWRNVKLTVETDTEKLKDDSTNYLIISTSPFKVVFNDYKTYKKYKQQVFELDDPYLNEIITQYIVLDKLKPNDYLFHLQRSVKEIISEPDFSSKVSNVFKKVYDIPISVRYIRMSWASALYSKNPTVREIKEITNKMAHSVDESSKYKKIFKKN